MLYKICVILVNYSSTKSDHSSVPLNHCFCIIEQTVITEDQKGFSKTV